VEHGQQPMRSLEDARGFIESVGFCTLYPARPAILCPTFAGAWVGSDANLPTWQNAYADAAAAEASAMMVRLLRAKDAFESNVFGETGFLVAASVFPYFYALVGDRNPKQDLKKLSNQVTPLVAETFDCIQKHGPITKQRLKQILGGALSDVALDRA